MFKDRDPISNVSKVGNVYSSSIPKFYLEYRALVVDNEDEERMGRVRVYIPELFDDQNVGTNVKDKTIWAYPGNNTFGGRKIVPEDSTDYSYQGSAYVPAKNTWWIVRFEDGCPHKCFYVRPLDIHHFLLPPENVLGKQYWNKWTLFRSLDGRSIVVSDDPDDERVEITGRKRDIPTGKRRYTKEFLKEHTTEHIQRINLNQKVILIDDRDGKEKILIADDHGNYINIDTQNNNIYVHSMEDTRIYAEGKIYISVLDDAHIKCNKDIYIHAEKGQNGGGNFYLKADESIYMSANKNIHIKAGSSIFRQAGGDINDLAGNKAKYSSQQSMNIKSIQSDTYIDAAGIVHKQLPGAETASPAITSQIAQPAEMNGDRHYLDKWKNKYNEKSDPKYKKDDRDYPKLDGNDIIKKYTEKFIKEYTDKIKRRTNTKNDIL